MNQYIFSIMDPTPFIYCFNFDTLWGNEIKARPKRVPASQLKRSIGRISELPKPKQHFVMEMLETVLAQGSH
jgi:hypothetical protein